MLVLLKMLLQFHITAADHQRKEEFKFYWRVIKWLDIET